ncbi:g6858 [Coccomyxa viridis]|uniref:Exocyst complex component SEC5 n=1 Tax=Coccomyxa viridis TaxID=1274662 RepID=A0ABP1G1C3_9CHLO
MLAKNTYDRTAGLGGYTRDNAPKAAAAIPEQYDLVDDEDIEEDDDPEAPTPQSSRGAVQESYLDGPASWDEVDTEELERIAVNILRSVVPSTENLEVGARLAMQAAAMGAENLDPLGLGRIDTRQLALIRSEHRTLGRAKSMAVRGSPATKVINPHTFPLITPRDNDGQPADDLAPSRRNITTLEGMQRRGMNLKSLAPGGDSAGNERATLAHLRSKVMPTQEKFDPVVYLGTVHWETTLADLQQGRNNLQRELNERTGQLKALVKENFDHFISCKTTIDDIHKRLREAEKGLESGNSSYVSTHDVIETVSEVQNVARHAFVELVERASACDRIRGVLALIKRHENLFRLPTRIRHATERGLYDQVITEYRKARALMAENATTPKGGVWQSLFQEVEKAVSVMANLLLDALRNTRTSPAEATDACKHLLQLQAEGSPCMEHCDPIQLYLTTQERHVHGLLEGALEEHMGRLRGMTQRIADKAAADARFKELQHLEEAGVLVDAKQAEGAVPGAARRAGADGASERVTVEQLWVKYAARLTGIVVRYLRADYWHMPQEKVQALVSISDNAKKHMERSRTDRARTYDTLLQQYSEKIISALTQLAGENRSKEAFLQAMRDATTGMTKLCGPSAPASVYTTLQQMLETFSGLAIGQMVAERATLVLRMSEIEDWDIVAASHKTGAPVSAMPGRLRAVVSRGMEQVQAVLVEAQRAEAVAPARKLNVLGTSAASLRGAFFDSFASYAVATDRLSLELSAQAPPGEEVPDEDLINTDRKLLVLLSNCAFVRGSIMPSLIDRFRGLLAADNGEQEVESLAEECSEDIKQVELRLASTYTESKAHLLNDVLEEFFFDDGSFWEAAPLPRGPRDVTFELINTMIVVEAEAYSNAPGLLRRGLEELLQHLLATFTTILDEQLSETNLGGTLQLLVDLKFLAGAFSPLVKAPHEASIAACRQLITEQAVALAQGQSDEPDPLAERLDAWLDSCEASAPSKSGESTALEDRIQRACRSKALVALKEARANIACFREAPDQGGPPALNRAMESSASSSKSAASQMSMSSARAFPFGRT